MGAGVSLALMFLFFTLMVNIARDAFCVLGIIFMTLCYHFTIRLVIISIMERISLSNFDPESRRFRGFEFEDRLWKILRVKKWKTLIPAYDKQVFSIKRPLEELAGETCRSESVHILCALASLSTILFATMFGVWPAFIITGVLGALIDLAYVAVMRYNRPRLIKHTVRRR